MWAARGLCYNRSRQLRPTEGRPLKLSALGAGVLLLDQLSKAVVSRTMSPGQSLALMSEILHVTYVQNPGAAFGLFAYQTPFLVAATVFLAILAWVYRQDIARQSLALRLGLTLGLAGAAGNLIDRVGRGWVVDFIDLRVWPVFNVADMAIVAGVAIGFWCLLRQPARNTPGRGPEGG